MKKFLLVVVLLVICRVLSAQSTYIQVNGEPGLSVYLNNQLKGTTSAEYNGFIIENVTPGANVIKIVKEGYTPFEETITVKKGEVFSYKVKPFTKHIVNISEQGNTAATEKKAEITTGKLVVQSVPIEIKITMPNIEGVNNIAKTKDQWMADKVPAGNYEITFTFNQKSITKTVEIDGDNTTSVFVNMLNGEFTAKSTVSESRKKAQEIAYLHSIFDRYKYKSGLYLNDFMRYNPEARVLLSYQWGTTGDFIIQQKVVEKNRELSPGPSYLMRRYLGNKQYAEVTLYSYRLSFTKDYLAAKAVYDAFTNELKKNITLLDLETTENNTTVTTLDQAGNILTLWARLNTLDNKWYEVELTFR